MESSCNFSQTATNSSLFESFSITAVKTNNESIPNVSHIDPLQEQIRKQQLFYELNLIKRQNAFLEPRRHQKNPHSK